MVALPCPPSPCAFMLSDGIIQRSDVAQLLLEENAVFHSPNLINTVTYWRNCLHFVEERPVRPQVGSSRRHHPVCYEWEAFFPTCCWPRMMLERDSRSRPSVLPPGPWGRRVASVLGPHSSALPQALAHRAQIRPESLSTSRGTQPPFPGAARIAVLTCSPLWVLHLCRWPPWPCWSTAPILPGILALRMCSGHVLYLEQARSSRPLPMDLYSSLMALQGPSCLSPSPWTPPLQSWCLSLWVERQPKGLNGKRSNWIGWWDLGGSGKPGSRGTGWKADPSVLKMS